MAILARQEESMRKHKQLRAIQLIVSKSSGYILFDLIVLKHVDLAVVCHADDYLRREPYYSVIEDLP